MRRSGIERFWHVCFFMSFISQMTGVSGVFYLIFLTFDAPRPPNTKLNLHDRMAPKQHLQRSSWSLYSWFVWWWAVFPSIHWNNRAQWAAECKYHPPDMSLKKKQQKPPLNIVWNPFHYRHSPSSSSKFTSFWSSLSTSISFSSLMGSRRTTLFRLFFGGELIVSHTFCSPRPMQHLRYPNETNMAGHSGNHQTHPGAPTGISGSLHTNMGLCARALASFLRSENFLDAIVW